MCRASGTLTHCWCQRGAMTTGRFDNSTPVKEDETMSWLFGNNKRTVRITKQSGMYYVRTRWWWRRLLLSSTVGATRVPPPDATHAYPTDMRPKHTWLSPLLLHSSCSFDYRMSWVDGCLSARSLKWWPFMISWKEDSTQDQQHHLGKCTGEYRCRKHNNLIMRFYVPNSQFLRMLTRLSSIRAKSLEIEPQGQKFQYCHLWRERMNEGMDGWWPIKKKPAL